MTIHDTYSFKHRVPYSQCTLGNHVYYSRFFDMLELARGEMLRSLGHPFLDLQNKGFMFPVAEASAKYYGPVKYDDLIDIQTWLIELSQVRVHFAYKIRTEDQTVIVEAKTLHACTTTSENRLVRIPEDLKASLNRFVAG